MRRKLCCKESMPQERANKLAIAIVMSMLFVSCASAPPKPTNQVNLVLKEIAAPNTKVYADLSVDWSNNNILSVDLQEVGAPEHSRNQILEKYLLQQAEDCFRRKGYGFSDTESAARVRIYFETKQTESPYSSALAYGFSSSQAHGSFLTELSLASGVWKSSMVAATEWNVVQVSNSTPIYEGVISIEVFDKTNTQQLWRGDVRTTLSTDDIRVVSNTLIREVLWYFPALDYPSIWVPEVTEKEYNRIRGSALMNREFYSPGQRVPTSFCNENDQA